MNTIQRIAAFFTTVALVASLFGRVGAQAPPSVVALQFNLSTVANTNWLPLSGQNVCTVTFASTTNSTGVSITVQGASDAPILGTQTPVTVLGLGTAGIISTPAASSSYGGSIAPQALTYIRLSQTAISGGATIGSLSCSTAVGSTGTSVTVANTPGVTVVNNPTVNQGTNPWLIGGTGTAGTPATQVLSIQGITAGFPLPISGTVTANASLVSPLPLPVSLPTSSTLPVSLATTIPVSIATTLPVNCTTGCAAPINGGAVGVATGAPAAIALAGANGATLDSLGSSVTAGATPPPTLGILFVQNPVPQLTATALPTHAAGAGAADAVCAAACTVYTGGISNNNGTAVFCALYDIAAASVNPGTSVFKVPVIAAAGVTTPLYLGPTNGGRFTTAAAISCTTTFNGATPVGAGTVNVWFGKL